MHKPVFSIFQIMLFIVIVSSAFNSWSQPSFTRITDDPIVAPSEGEYNAAWADFDGDQDLDLFTGGSQKLYQNNGDGSFTQLTNHITSTLLATVPAGAIWGDYDNDGLLDLFVAGLGIDHFFWHRLFHGTGNGTFESIEPGISHLTKSYHAAWVDYDNDGFIDLFLPDTNSGSVNRLYRNNGNGAFSVVEALNITSLPGAWTACAWADFDDDGYSDVFLVNGASQPDALFRNNGNGEFSPFSTQTFEGETEAGTAATWGDYDNDGDLDLLVTNSPGTNALYRNDGDSFTKILSGDLVSFKAGSKGAAWGDYDNDGWLDIFVANKMVHSEQYPVMFFFHNNQNGTFTRLTTGPILDERLSSTGPVWVDYDGNGLLDLFLLNSGYIEWPTSGSNALFQNDGPAGNWIKIRLTGNSSNRSAIGAKIKMVSQTDGNLLRQLRFISADGGYQSQNLEIHFGLGDANFADEIIVVWPSGAVTTLTNIAANQTLIVEESTIDIELVPAGQTFSSSIEISINSQVPESTIYYSTDGSNPDNNSKIYTEPLLLTESTTVKARLYVSGNAYTDIISETYILVEVQDIKFNPPGGLFTNQIEATLVNNVGTGHIHYTTDGSTPTSSSPEYSEPISLTAAATIRAQVYFNTFPISETFEESYLRVYAFEDDGVAFDWRERYFGPDFLTDPRSAANADFDNDGYTVADEYAAGTDPTNNSSVPLIELDVQTVPLLTFNTIKGRTYRVQRATTLSPPDWQTIVESIASTNSHLNFVDQNAPSDAYYRIQLIENE